MLKTPPAADLLFLRSIFSGTVIDKVNDVNLKELNGPVGVPTFGDAPRVLSPAQWTPISGFLMTVRMKDIARDLSVSVVMISKVLHNHPDVGDETRERVLARVKELDYRPNLAARGLVTGRTHLIGLVVPDLLHPFFAEIPKISLSLRYRGRGF